MKRLLTFFLFCSALYLVPAGRSDAAWIVLDEPNAWLNASDHTSGEVAQFGFSVAIDDGTIVVGAPLGRTPDSRSDGQVYLFLEPPGGWGDPTEVLTESAILRACSPGVSSQNFGHSVDVDGERIAVGARYEDEFFLDTGAGYLFQKANSGWVTSCAPDPLLPGLTAKVTASDADSDDRFGVSAAISGERALFGAYKDDERNFDAGASYLYTLETLANADPTDDFWIPAGGEKLFADFPPDYPPLNNDFAGEAVALSSPANSALVAAANLNLTGPRGGKVYAYDLGGTPAVVQVLENPLGEKVGDLFGTEVAISPDGLYAAVAQTDNDQVAAGGLVHIFRMEGGHWELSARLDAPDAQIQDFFGNAVAISSERVVVGVEADDDQGPNSGSAWVFVRRDGNTPSDPNDDTWEPEFKLLPPAEGGDLAGRELTQFGNAVDISGNTVVVGRSDDDWDGLGTGSAYVYELPPPFELAVAGSCPGELAIDIQGGEAGGDAVLVAAASTGTTVVPIGDCAGSTVDLAEVIATRNLTLDPQGKVTLTVSLPVAACGTHLQVLDLATCRTTQVTVVP